MIQTASVAKKDPKKATALLLSCMDLRVIDETAWLMQELGLHNEYDHVAIAGASLGALVKEYRAGNGKMTSIAHFGQTFWTHVELAIALHAIDKVVIVEHLDCGAYKHFMKDPVFVGKPPITEQKLLEPAKPRSSKEEKQHDLCSKALAKEITKKYSKLSVKRYLIGPWRDLDKA